MLEVRDIHSYYGLAHVLQGVSLTVPAKTVIALLGRNGMGKTTLIRSIMGLSPPVVRSGSVVFRGEELRGKAANAIARKGLGLVPQGRRLFPSLTVQEHLTMVRRPPSGDGAGRVCWDLPRIYELFPRLAERQNHRGGQLSGGERQMLAIARALMTNPDLLLMDEPSEGLAPLLVQRLREELAELKTSGLSILLVEQNVRLALAVADHVHIIERGRIVYQGRPAELQAERALMQKYLGVGV
ncbi:MAG TPA: ABC transporter ATP-binding protein [Chloroflexota bacterium]|nr:ABC transporter ATP-binding protein [Chloroflexota bacterium]